MMTRRRSGPPTHCMIVHAYYPLAETRVQREAEALIAAGYEVDIVALRLPDEAPLETVNGVTVHRLPVRRDRGRATRGFGAQLVEYANFTVRSTIKVARLHLRRRYRVVQVHNPPDFLIAAGILPRLLGARLVLDLHDLMPEFLASKLGTGLEDRRVRLTAVQERLACAVADHVITVTELWRSTLVARRTVRADRCTVVMNVADTAYFRPRAPTAHKDVEEAEFRLLYHGTLAHRYGVDLLVRAVARLRDEIPGLRLTIHGRGEARESLPGLVEQLGVADIVTLSFDFVPVEELPVIIASADLGVVPYRRDVFTDGILPTKLLEYAALGVPAIAARTTAITATFNDSMVEFMEPGDLDDLVDRIRALHGDPQRRARMVAAMARFSAEHGWPIVSATYVGLIDRLSRHGRDDRSRAGQ